MDYKYKGLPKFFLKKCNNLINISFFFNSF